MVKDGVGHCLRYKLLKHWAAKWRKPKRRDLCTNFMNTRVWAACVHLPVFTIKNGLQAGVASEGKIDVSNFRV